jgi:trehalose 6-phosphate phosphatase
MAEAMETRAALPAPPPLADLKAGGPVALFLDFDGTLVEIAPTPDSINVPGSLGDRLEVLAASLEHRLALVSGRSIEDIEHHLGSLAVARAGSHGAARQTATGEWLGEAPQPLADDIRSRLQEFAADEGLNYERKPHGAALHFRSAPELEAAAVAFAARLAEGHGLEIKTGKCVVELVHAGANKGDAVFAFMKNPPFAGSRPIFVGDDVTDEDGFRACAEIGGTGILVGERRDSSAQFRLSSVAAVHQWLGL